MDFPEDIVIYTDGSCYPNPKGPGGWAFVAKWREIIEERSGFIPESETSSNNFAELTAIHRALTFLKPTKHSVVIVTDSKWAMNSVRHWYKGWMRNGWTNSKGEPVAHQELIREVVRLIEEHQETRELRITYTKGHAGTALNELADSLAGLARTSRTGNEKGCTPFV